VVTLPWPRPLFEKFFRGHVQTVSGNTPAQFEVCSFDCIGSRQQSSLTLQNRWTKVVDLSIAAVSPYLRSLWQHVFKLSAFSKHMCSKSCICSMSVDVLIMCCSMLSEKFSRHCRKISHWCQMTVSALSKKRKTKLRINVSDKNTF